MDAPLPMSAPITLSQSALTMSGTFPLVSTQTQVEITISMLLARSMIRVPWLWSHGPEQGHSCLVHPQYPPHKKSHEADETKQVW